MKKLVLFLVFLGVIAVSSLYLFRSGTLFMDGIKNFQGKQNVAAGLSFAELITKYPYSPFVAVARVYMVHKDPTNLTYIDMYFQTKQKKDIFEAIVGRSPAYYDPYYFMSVVFFLVMSMIGVAQRYWAGSLGLSFKGLMTRDSFALFMLVTYFFWVRGAYMIDSPVYRLAGSVSSWLNTVEGATAVTVSFSVIMTVVNIFIILLTLFTFLGSSNKKQSDPAPAPLAESSTENSEGA